ncbi:MAG: factor-independent urate hydroxylase [Anaerolineales bacterium]
MSPRLAWHGYGKAAVRLVKVDRADPSHHLHDLTVEVQLQGEFETAHTAGDNSAILPTDTMKNAVYALARQGPVAPPEAFGERLGRHFLAACPAARRVVVTLVAHGWDRVQVRGTPHDHAFVRGPEAQRLAFVTVEGSAVGIEAGVLGLGLLKTTGSAFAGFLEERYTTLKETRDRIFATEVQARWRYGGGEGGTPSDFDAAWDAIRGALVETFARHQSESVQQTLYAMGNAALEACPEADEIRLVLPNQHHLLVDLSPFGLDNPNQIFVATREPFGRIEALITR